MTCSTPPICKAKPLRNHPMKISPRIWILVSAVGLSSSLPGCATVQPWQRGTLSDYTMMPDRDPLHAQMSEHTFFSRETAHGGAGVGGGGCGCH